MASIGSSQPLLALAFNLLSAFEFEYEEKVRLRKIISKNRHFNVNEINEINSANSLISQLFDSNPNINFRGKDINWQVTSLKPSNHSLYSQA